MADIELVVKVDENIYRRLINGFTDEVDATLIEELFKNATRLPKIHGNLKDEDLLKHYADKYGDVNVIDIEFSKTFVKSNKDPDSIWRILED